ncbi:aldo/keto reductase [Saccharopolyspora spinosporotrichia]
MKPTRLPGTDVPLSPLVLGTMTFGDTVDAAAAGRMLDVALEAGITGVDTANGYAGGAAEEILAGLLRSRRDRVVLATKAGIPHPDAGEHSRCRHAGSGPVSKAACGGWAPTASTCSTCTNPTGRHRWPRR